MLVQWPMASLRLYKVSNVHVCDPQGYHACCHVPSRLQARTSNKKCHLVTKNLHRMVPVEFRCDGCGYNVEVFVIYLKFVIALVMSFWIFHSGEYRYKYHRDWKTMFASDSDSYRRNDARLFVYAKLGMSRRVHLGICGMAWHLIQPYGIFSTPLMVDRAGAPLVRHTLLGRPREAKKASSLKR